MGLETNSWSAVGIEYTSDKIYLWDIKLHVECLGLGVLQPCVPTIFKIVICS
jgi:hypothetical protein